MQASSVGVRPGNWPIPERWQVHTVLQAGTDRRPVSRNHLSYRDPALTRNRCPGCGVPNERHPASTRSLVRIRITSGERVVSEASVTARGQRDGEQPRRSPQGGCHRSGCSTWRSQKAGCVYFA